jgi:hypothetical protein
MEKEPTDPKRKCISQIWKQIRLEPNPFGSIKMKSNQIVKNKNVITKRWGWKNSRSKSRRQMYKSDQKKTWYRKKSWIQTLGQDPTIWPPPGKRRMDAPRPRCSSSSWASACAARGRIPREDSGGVLPEEEVDEQRAGGDVVEGEVVGVDEDIEMSGDEKTKCTFTVCLP